MIMAKKNNDFSKTIISPPKKWVPIQLKEIWAHKELLYFFIWRDIKVRYKQTGLGVTWAIIQPLFAMIIFTVIFGNFAKIPSEGIPYPLFSYAAILPWTLFSEGLTRSTTSMTSNANIMTKVYFPRLILPIAGVLSPLIDFFISFIILIFLMLFYGYMPSINIIFFPLLLLLLLSTSLSVGVWLSSLNVQYRDFQYTLPFLIQIWLYASPIVYSSNLIPPKYQIIYGINPMAGVIEGSRWLLLGTSPPNNMIFFSIIVVIILLVSGLFYFKKMERYFADIV